MAIFDVVQFTLRDGVHWDRLAALRHLLYKEELPVTEKAKVRSTFRTATVGSGSAAVCSKCILLVYYSFALCHALQIEKLIHLHRPSCFLSEVDLHRAVGMLHNFPLC